ncbi:WhiB family transcriptional regulator [Jatrophihabitans sp. YIM 134969]
MADVRHLPPPKAETWAWQLGAACRGMDTSTFYHPDNERGPSRRRRERSAKAVCSGCPVTAQCLSWAIQTREPYGVWGGKSVEEREALIAVAAAGRTEQIAGKSA